MVNITRNQNGRYVMSIDGQMVETDYKTIVDASKGYENIMKEKENYESDAAFSKKLMGICQGVS